MAFRPAPEDELNIGDRVYRIAEHPAAPGMAYGQSGRRGTVYQLMDEEDKAWALKVFLPQFREPRLAGHAERIRSYSKHKGLSVCEREVLTASRYADLLRVHMELAYAVLMPWIPGPTWQEIVLGEDGISSLQSLNMARALTYVLVGMEEQGLAHCDLSGPNIMFTPEGGVELVDLEEMYGSELTRPSMLPGGSPGYAHKTAPEGLWQPEADRFAGAVLLGEILGWCDSGLRERAWGEGYFEPGEMQGVCDRYPYLVEVLKLRWGMQVRRLFERVWWSDTLSVCPTFAEWVVALPEKVPKSISVDKSCETPQKSVSESLNLHMQEEEGFKEEVRVKTETVEVQERTEAVETSKKVDVQEHEWTCPECGVVVEGSFEICPFCERGMRSDTSGSEILTQPQKRISTTQLQGNWIRWAMISGVVLVVVVLGMMRGGIFTKPESPEETSPVISVTQSVTKTEKAHLMLNQTETPTSSPIPSLTPTMTPTSSPTATPTEETQVITEDNISRIVRLSTLEMDAHTESFSNDGSLVALVTCISGVPIFCHDEISVLHLPDGRRLKSLGELNTGVRSIDFSPDGSLLAIGSTNGELRIWDFESEEDPIVIQGHQAIVSTVVWSPDGALLASGGFDEVMKIWDTSTWEVLYSIEVQYRDWYFNEVESLAWSPKGDLLAIGSHTGVVHIWSRSQGAIIQNLVTNAVGFGADEVSWSPDGELLAGNGYYVHYDYAGHAPEMGLAKVWETDTWSEVNLPKETYGSISWSPEGSLIVTKDRLEGFVIRDAEGWGEMKRIEEVTDYAWSMDGSTLALVISYETFELWGLPED